MTDLYIEQEEFMYRIRGAGASAIILLMITGRSLTNKKIRETCNYSDKPMTAALNYLQRKGIVHYVSRTSGYALGNGITMLPFSPAQLQGVFEQLQSINFDALEVGETAVIPAQHEFDFPEQTAVLADKIIDPTPAPVERDRNNSDLIAALKDAKINGRFFTKFLKDGIDPHIVTAWYWYARSAGGWCDQPTGYVVKRLQMGELPEQGFINLARIWGNLPQLDRFQLCTAATGDKFGKITLPPRDSHELRQQLGKDYLPELNQTTLTAVLKVAKNAPELLETEHNGYE